MTKESESKKNFWEWLHQWIRAILFALYKLPFILIMIILGLYAFWLNDQGQDLMASFTQVHFFDNNYLQRFYTPPFSLGCIDLGGIPFFAFISKPGKAH
jgi:hypothetical protein